MDGFEFGGFLVSQERGVVHSEVLRVVIFLFIFGFLANLLFGIFLDDFLAQFLDSLVRDPLVIPSIQWLVVDVVLVGSFILFSSGIIIYIIKWK